MSDARPVEPGSEQIDPSSQTSSKPLWKRGLHLLAALVLLAVVAVFVIYAVPAVIGADHSFVVMTGSMAPEIEPGDAVVVGEQDPATIETGDVITFYRGDAEAPVTHRVIGVEQTSDGYLYETQGDANDEPDANPVPHENVLGTVVLTIPAIGHVIEFANTTEGFLALVVLPFGLLALNEVWSFAKGSRDESAATESGDGDGALEDGQDPEQTAASEDTLVVTDRILVRAVGVLAVLAPVSGLLAYLFPMVVTVSVAIATAICLVLVAVLWLSSRGDDPSEELEDATETTSDELEEPDPEVDR
ncbi:signal peptidase I [Natronococcus roseus]|uniref:signal peptidase I n=1 Tax=Natronococcus roseus TaxID=1052014 RepID=UPI00374D4398